MNSTSISSAVMSSGNPSSEISDLLDSFCESRSFRKYGEPEARTTL